MRYVLIAAMLVATPATASYVEVRSGVLAPHEGEDFYLPRANIQGNWFPYSEGGPWTLSVTFSQPLEAPASIGWSAYLNHNEVIRGDVIWDNAAYMDGGVRIPAGTTSFSYTYEFWHVDRSCWRTGKIRCWVNGMTDASLSLYNGGSSPLEYTAVLTGVPFVPEPASWAMMIVGFGTIGATLRRRRSVASHQGVRARVGSI